MTRRCRIAMVAACPYQCARGTPIRVRGLAEALAELGHEVHIATYHLGEPAADRRVHVHRIPNLPTYRRLAPGPTYQKLLVVDVLLAAKLARLLRKRPFDLIHAHHYEGLLAALLARRGRAIPILFDAHTLLASELPAYDIWPTRGLKRALGRTIDRLLPPRADHTIAVSEDIRARLLACGALTDDRISVVGNGVELDLFDPHVQAPRVQGGPPTAIFTGNLAPYQGVDLMLQAFALVRAWRRDARLVIVSENSFEPYEKMARELGIRDALVPVETGFTDVPSHLRAADVALNPRCDSPGVAHKVLNYMAAGRAIVSFAGSAKHLVHGKTAWILSDGEVSAFAEAIVRLMDDQALARRLGDNARAYAEAKFSWRASAQRAEDVYARVLGIAGSRLGDGR